MAQSFLTGYVELRGKCYTSAAALPCESHCQVGTFRVNGLKMKIREPLTLLFES
jgi:hypothetical protein